MEGYMDGWKDGWMDVYGGRGRKKEMREIKREVN